MLMNRLFLLLSVFICTLTASAQTDGLVMRYDFTDVSGVNVNDAVSGITASLQNGASVEKMGRYSVLNLGNGTGYLDMTAAAGKVFAGNDNYSVSVYYRADNSLNISGNGFFLWSFSTSDNCLQNDGKYSAYRINAQRYATSTGGYAHETGIETGSASEKSRWISIVYTEQNGTGSLYIDGTLVGTQTGMPLNSSNYGANTPVYNWIGRSPFTADLYLTNTLVTDFRVYNRQLSASEIASIASETADLDNQYMYGTPGDVSALNNAISAAEAELENSSSYLPGAVEDLKDIITVAKSYAGQGYSQTILDQQVSDLNSAVEAMKATAGMTFVPSKGITEAYDTDRGFIHPGGLHTQADFDRIKRQLKEGNQKVTEAWNVLKNAEYAQSTVATWPVETIIRGAGAQNYINAARGATMAYQNALRWKIEDNKDCGQHAVSILLQWANTTKGIGGNSNYALAAGLYGYEFAQAAELVRDLMTPAQMNTMRQWFLNVWYPSAIGFLRGRNGTWENSANKPAAGWGDAGNRPGHYWSNWGLCNTLCVMSIGLFCDDVFIYNQGISYFKYDQVGSYVDPRTAVPILNDGLTEYLGNLVVTTADTPDTLEASGYGKMGQMQESGRDVGHATMALGLATDIAHMGWNQGDDLFAYMDHRLAAGIEFTAAVNCGMTKLPWMDYKYCDCRTAWHGGWYMSGPSLGSQVRPYWGTIIGIYEGVKGIKMPYAEKNLEMMGIDGGGTGGQSGAYDHLGYSVLMNTRDVQLAPKDSVPTELSPLMEYDGQQIAHNELGGLENTYIINTNTCLPKGKSVKLMPQLPDGESDTGLWSWNTGETTKDITVTTDKSYVYRVTYTNANGVKSMQNFTLAVAGDCDHSSNVTVSAVANGENLGTDTVTVFYGSTLTLTASSTEGWGSYMWDNGTAGATLLTAPVTRERDYQVNFTNQGGAIVSGTIHVKVNYQRPQTIVNGQVKEDTLSVVVNPNDNVVVGPYVPASLPGVSYQWSDGSTNRTITIDSISSSVEYDLVLTVNGEEIEQHYSVSVCDTADTEIAPGKYMIRRVSDGTLLTNNSTDQVKSAKASFKEATTDEADRQIWDFSKAQTYGYDIVSVYDNRHLAMGLSMSNSVQRRGMGFRKALGTEHYAVSNYRGFYWEIDSDGNITAINTTTIPTVFDVELIPVSSTGINSVTTAAGATGLPAYNLAGQRVGSSYKGVVISGGKKSVRK